MEVHTDSITTASKSPVTSSFSQNRAPCYFHRWCDAEPSLGPLIVHLSMRFQILRCPTKVSGMKATEQSLQNQKLFYMLSASGRVCRSVTEERTQAEKEMKLHDSSERPIMAEEKCVSPWRLNVGLLFKGTFV